MVIAYLMRTQGLDLQASWDLVKSKCWHLIDRYGSWFIALLVCKCTYIHVYIISALWTMAARLEIIFSVVAGP